MSDFPRTPSPAFTPVEVVSDGYDPAAATFNAPLADLCERTEYLLAHLGGVEERLSLVADDTLSAPAEGVRERRIVLTAPPAAIVFSVPDTFGALLQAGDRLLIQVVGTGVGTVQIAGSNAGFLLGAHKSDFDASGDFCVLRHDSEWLVEAVAWSRPIEIVQKIVDASTTLTLPSEVNHAVVWAVGGGGGASGGQASDVDGGGATIYAGDGGGGGGAGESVVWNFFDAETLEIGIGAGGSGSSGDFARAANPWGFPTAGGNTTCRATYPGAAPPGGWPTYTARGGRPSAETTLDSTFGGLPVEISAGLVSDALALAKLPTGTATPVLAGAVARVAAMTMPGAGAPANCAAVGPTQGNRTPTTTGPDGSSGGRTFKGSNGGGAGGMPVPRAWEPTKYLNGQGRTGGGGPGGTGRTDGDGLPGSNGVRAGCGGGGGAGGPAPLSAGGFRNSGGSGGNGAAGLVAVYVWR